MRRDYSEAVRVAMDRELYEDVGVNGIDVEYKDLCRYRTREADLI